VDVDFGTVVKEELDDFQVAGGGGIGEGRFVLLGSDLGVGPSAEKEADGFGTAGLGGGHEGGGSGGVPGVDVGLSFDEEAHCGEAVASGGDERGHAVQHRDVGIGTFVKEKAHGVQRIRHGGSLVERGPAVSGFGVGIRSAFEEKADFRFVGDSPEERSGFALVTGVGVGTLGEETLHGFDVAEAGGVVEEGGSGAVVGVDEFGVGGEKLRGGGQIFGADGRDECGELGVHRDRGRLSGDLDAEVSSLVDPGAEDADFVIGKWAGRGHLEATIAVDKTENEFAASAVSGHDDGAVIAAAHGVLPFIESETGLLGVVTVAGVTLLGKDRLDFLFEVDFVCGGRGELGVGESRDRDEQEERRDAHMCLQTSGSLSQARVKVNGLSAKA